MVVPLLGVLASPVAHVVKVLCELSQVWTLLFILLLGPKQHLRDLEKISRGWLRVQLGVGVQQCWPAKRQRLLYLDLIEELGIQESELICNLMTAEVVERSRPVRTQIHISPPDQMELNYPNDYETFNIIFFQLQCWMTARIYAIAALESYLAETPRAASGLRELV